jgi:hypothetical protein
MWRKITLQGGSASVCIPTALEIERYGGKRYEGIDSNLPLHQHFKIFRDYIEHEDGLIDKRLLWNINIQGFLFATYGFSLQKLAEVEAGSKWHGATPEMIGAKALYWLIFVLPFLGIFISVYSFKGVRAAQHAIRKLKADWGDAKNQHMGNSLPALPGITGGGYESRPDKDDAHKAGFKAPLMFPLIFITVWFALLLTYILPIDFKSNLASVVRWLHWLFW